MLSLAKVDAAQARKIISIVWLTVLVLFFAAFVAGCTAAASSKGAASGGLKFAAAWSVIITAAVAALGTLIMRKAQTPLAMGGFLGSVSVLSMQYLILTAVFGSEAQEAGKDDKEYSDNVAFSVFSFILFVVFAVFGFLFFSFKHHLIRTFSLDTHSSDFAIEDDPQDFGQPGYSLPPAPDFNQQRGLGQHPKSVDL